MADSQDTTLLPELTRPMIEAEIERLIAWLDDMDPDPDLEPMLGAPETSPTGWPQTAWARGTSDDLEEASEDEGNQCDDEGAIEIDWEDSGDYGKFRESGEDYWRIANLCQASVAKLQEVQRRRGETPVRSLRVVGGAIVKR